MTLGLNKQEISVRLADICDFITKGATPTTYGHGWQATGVLFLRSECVASRGLDLEQSKFISEKANHSLQRSQVIDGDLLMTITGNVGRVILLEGVGVANINQHIVRIRLRDQRFDSWFIYHYLSQKQIRENYESITTGQAYPQLSLAQVRDTVIKAPPIGEQRAVAAYLNVADSLIAVIERIIVKKEAIKRGMMQQLLTGKTRLPGFVRPWKEWSMDSLGNTYGGLAGKTKNDFGVGRAQYVPFMAVMTGVRVARQSLLRVRVTSGERQNAVKLGDLLFNASSETPDELALCAVAGDLPEDTYLNSFCFGFRLSDADTADPLFIAYLFRSEIGRRFTNTLAQGAIRYNLSRSQFRNMLVILPSVDEQHAIAGVLESVDADIGALRDRLTKAKAIKQGMMQELLTGRTRLSVAEEVAA
jgi:type I restriction enzyme, S subunit